MTDVRVEVKAYTAGMPTRRIFLAVGFGESGTDRYVVRTDGTGPPLGAGVVTVDGRGDDVVVSFDAVTREGLRLVGSVTCHDVAGE